MENRFNLFNYRYIQNTGEFENVKIGDKDGTKKCDFNYKR